MVRTCRLELRAGTPDELGASIGPSAALAAALGCVVPTDWPPLHWEAGPVDWMLGKMREQPDEVFWRAWFVLWRPGAESAGTVGAGPETPVPTLVGTIGFKGPPGAPGSDADGVVEIGYSVVDSFHRRGIASEGVAAMLEWAAADPRVRAFRAHTLAGDPASAGVLLKNAFRLVATIEDPDDGRIDRYERSVGTANSPP
ncbi:MAG: GNAT family N-acetyltransferase [Phycisphaeraceae bacterium]|nr:GNAT family N-acetyltransferase [Phycisphaeraceae bacterium]